LTFPADSAYNESVSTYYAADNRLLRPFCIVQPRSTEDVSSALKLLSTVKGAGSWAVAIRSGGHSDWNNNAAHRGVTIDLSFLNSTTLIGPAGKWTGKSAITNVSLHSPIVLQANPNLQPSQ
jgi:FAD/FMN-containing dehydrogenase